MAQYTVCVRQPHAAELPRSDDERVAVAPRGEPAMLEEVQPVERATRPLVGLRPLADRIHAADNPPAPAARQALGACGGAGVRTFGCMTGESFTGTINIKVGDCVSVSANL